jgi:maltose O-acetyltransferase
VPGPLARLDPRAFARRDVDSACWHWFVNVLAASPAWSPEVRARLLRRAGIDAGTTKVESGCFFFGDNIAFGEWGWVNHRCYLDTRDKITLGDSAILAMEVMLCTSTHEIGDERVRAGEYRTGPVAIGNGCWLGARALVLPGVTVADGCVVAAGAVVAEDTEPNGVYAGVPARRVKDLA